RDLVAPELDPRNRVVMADAEHAEAEIADHALGRLDRPELLLRDLRVIGNPRRQARRRGLVPRFEARAPGELAYLRFRQPGLVERAHDAELARCLAAGPVVAAVVRVAAVGHGVEAAVARNRREMRIELVLAVVAAVGGIRAVLGTRYLG